MKNHITTIILLVVAAVAFVLRFYVQEHVQVYCDVVAFAFPTLAAIVEIYVSERSGKRIDEEIKKRPVWETLTQEEYDRRKAEGKIDENTFYATIEENK